MQEALGSVLSAGKKKKKAYILSASADAPILPFTPHACSLTIRGQERREGREGGRKEREREEKRREEKKGWPQELSF
jgi:hypothetical protein